MTWSHKYNITTAVPWRTSKSPFLWLTVALTPPQARVWYQLGKCSIHINNKYHQQFTNYGHTITATRSSMHFLREPFLLNIVIPCIKNPRAINWSAVILFQACHDAWNSLSFKDSHNHDLIFVGKLILTVR